MLIIIALTLSLSLSLLFLSPMNDCCSYSPSCFFFLIILVLIFSNSLIYFSPTIFVHITQFNKIYNSMPLISYMLGFSAGRPNYWLLICEMLYLRYTLRHIFWAPLWLDKMNAWFKLENCTLKGSINIKIFLWFFHERASIYYHYAQKKMKMWHSCIDAR